MQLLKYMLIVFLMLLNINSQTITFNEDSTAVGIENNRLYFPLNNNGTLGGYFSSLNESNATYDEKNIIYTSGLFLSGYSKSLLWANAVAYSSLIEDYQPGTIESLQDSPFNKIYVVKATDVPFGKEWQAWKNAVDQGAYFYDGDKDGLYNPVDKNNNGQWDIDEDKPDILYDASLFTVYNDGVPAENRRWNTVNPLGIEIRQTVFVSNKNTILDDVVFVRYSILYKGLGEATEPDSLTDVIFSIFSDCDIGDTFESSFYDLSGCDTLLNSGYTYNEYSEGSFDGSPPAVFKTIVQGPLLKSNNLSDIGYNRMGPDIGVEQKVGFKNLGLEAYVCNTNSSTATDLPNNKVEARNYMLGLTVDGEPLDPCNWNFGAVSGEVDCAEVNPLFWYSGNPVTNTGWMNTHQDDYKDITSTGKFTLRKNEPMDIIVAYTVGRGTDALNSITVARETVQYVLEEYERNFSTIVGVEENNREELSSSFKLFQNYPNPFNPTTTIKFTTPPRPSPYQGEGVREGLMTSLKIYDLLGREVATLVNEVKPAGTYEIEFDASDLPSGVYFYKLSAGNFVESKKMLLLR